MNTNQTAGDIVYFTLLLKKSWILLIRLYSSSINEVTPSASRRAHPVSWRWSLRLFSAQHSTLDNEHDNETQLKGTYTTGHALCALLNRGAQHTTYARVVPTGGACERTTNRRGAQRWRPWRWRTAGHKPARRLESRLAVSIAAHWHAGGAA